ncbi:hypothetical protein K438DRAFT_1966533 [Mycena galopus ATCC 62051]|nr:hypothetical protein K438DRAFT_1966533 [Mycena galopus ATCC 62051]
MAELSFDTPGLSLDALFDTQRRFFPAKSKPETQTPRKKDIPVGYLVGQTFLSVGTLGYPISIKIYVRSPPQDRTPPLRATGKPPPGEPSSSVATHASASLGGSAPVAATDPQDLTASSPATGLKAHSSILQTPWDPLNSVLETPKNKYATGLVDQTVKSVCEIWRPQDIPNTEYSLSHLTPHPTLYSLAAVAGLFPHELGSESRPGHLQSKQPLTLFGLPATLCTNGVPADADIPLYRVRHKTISAKVSFYSNPLRAGSKQTLRVSPTTDTTYPRRPTHNARTSRPPMLTYRHIGSDTKPCLSIKDVLSLRHCAPSMPNA